jgi:hypothetical protein
VKYRYQAMYLPFPPLASGNLAHFTTTFLRCLTPHTVVNQRKFE